MVGNRTVDGRDAPMRTRKAPEVRRQELLDVAVRLFIEDGYDDASVNDIIREAGVSKGAFYHYFASKDDVLDAVAKRWVEGAVAIVESVVAQPGPDALEKLNRVIAAVQDYRSSYRPYAWHLYRLFGRGNVRLRAEVSRYGVELARDVYTRLVEQGIREGVFDTAYPDQIGGLIVMLRHDVSTSIAEALFERPDPAAARVELRRKLDFYENLLERGLGAPAGSVNLAEPICRYVWGEDTDDPDSRGAGSKNDVK
jgi:AcrR family transcriptional regulator